MSEDEHSWQVPEHRCDVFAPRKFPMALVIPVINEGDRILGQLEAISKLQAPVDVIIADGGSSDGSTAPKLLKHLNVRACLTKTGPGRLSAQLRMAYAWSLREGYDGIITMDGNGKDSAEDILRILGKLRDGYDYVQGSRYHREGRAINTPLSRWIAGRFIHAPLISLASRHWFTDTTNGFRGYSSKYLSDQRTNPFRDVFMNYNLLFYLSVRASQIGYRVAEVGVTRTYPDDGNIPTKIHGIGSKLRLMGELFGAVAGRYRP